MAKKNIDEALKEADADIVNMGNGTIPLVKGLNQVKAGLIMFSTALPVEKVEDIIAIAEGDWVMVSGRWTGSWKADMMGQAATGKPYSKKDIEIFKFNEAGKIIEHHSVQPILEIASQVGLKLPK